MEEIKLWMPLGVLVIQVLGLWIMWSLSRKFKTHDGCESCKSGLSSKDSELERRLQDVESTLRSTPGHKDVHDIKVSLEDVRGVTEALRAELEGNAKLLERVEKQLEMIVEYHLTGGK